MTSLKKLIAVLAVSLPLVASAQAPAATPPAAAPPAAAPPAAAPAPLFSIYGTLNLNFQFEEAPAATVPGQSINGRFGVSADSSNIGIRGALDTGRFGLGVVYQCETGAQLEGTGNAALCNRNSRLGVSSSLYGTLFYGNWDSPYKAAWYGTKADDAFGNTDVYDATALMSSPGFNTRSTAGITAGAAFTGPVRAPAINTPTTTTFAIRAADSVVYQSPKILGASFKAAYSANRFADTKAVRAPELWSAVVNYDAGPLSVLAAFEDHEDWQGVRSRDTAWKVGAGLELPSAFGTTVVGAVYEQLMYRAFGGTAFVGTAANAINKFTRPSLMVNLKHRTGNHELRARWTTADSGDCDLVSGAACSTAGFGAMNYTLGYAYYLTKAAQVYAYWTQIENERNASYTFATAGFAQVTAGSGAPIAGGTPVGSDPWATGLGMRYTF